MEKENKCNNTCCINNNPTMESVCDTCREKELKRHRVSLWRTEYGHYNVMATDSEHAEKLANTKLENGDSFDDVFDCDMGIGDVTN